MKLTGSIICLAFLAALLGSAVVRADDELKIQIHGNDNMKYDVTRIDCHQGQKVTITLTAVGELPKVAMSHNFVLLKAGTDVTAFAALAAKHEADGYMSQRIVGRTSRG